MEKQSTRSLVENYLNLLDPRDYPQIKGMMKTNEGRNRIIDVIIDKLVHKNQRQDVESAINEVELSLQYM